MDKNKILTQEELMAAISISFNIPKNQQNLCIEHERCGCYKPQKTSRIQTIKLPDGSEAEVDFSKE